MSDENIFSFREVKRTLPEPELVEVRPGLRLETLHLAAPAPALVFVHGGLASHWNPYLQLVHFRGTHELVSYALAGNGHSDDRDEHTVAGHVQDLADLLDTLNVTDPILVGWSYGTVVALEYAKQYSVNGLLLTGGGAFDLTPAWERPMMKLVLALRLYRVLPETAGLKWLAKFAAVHPETPDARIDAVLASNPLPRRRSAWRMVTEAFWDYDGRDGLDRIRCPVLVVHGPADGIVPIEVARETAEVLPNGEFYRLERTGHVAPVERPHAFNRLLEALIDAAQHPTDWPATLNAIDG